MKKINILLLLTTLYFSCREEESSIYLDEPYQGIEFDCTKDVYINKQEDLNDFNCKIVNGNLYVGSDKYSTLEIDENHFKSLEQVEKDLVISNVSKIDTNSFNTINKVLGNLNIISNKTLPSIKGFNNLNEIGLGLYIDKNSSLSSINGFAKLSKIGMGLYIYDNDNLLSLDGFIDDNLTQLNHLNVFGNSKLKSIDGFENLKELGGLHIYNNSSLESISGFNSTTEISSFGIEITSNKSLNDINGFENLQVIKGANFLDWGLNVENNKLLSCESLCPFSNKVVRGKYNIDVKKCSSLEDLIESCI